ncbi:MAG: substrate-binding domain-containing protein [Chloroflexi bacterium]|nr:substrate-binding domain-containing protein [Chloroflexota bacterium]
MMKKLVILASGLLLALSVAAPALAQTPKTFYWVSHGSPSDPVWTYFLAGATQWEQDTGNKVNTSFHSGDVPSQQDAIRAAIAAGASGIVTSSPSEGSLTEVVKEAHAAGIPVININTPDPNAGFDAYVGTNNVEVGRRWAQYLVDGGYVQAGDTVWTPVEVAGATYGEQEKQGIMSVFEPLGISIDAVETGLDQAQIISTMSDYLTANKDKVAAMIGLGDLVTGSVARVWDQVGVKAGDIPVVGWGNSPDTTQEILDGYVLAGMWQDPQMTSYLGLSLADAASSGIPPGFDILVGTLYEKDKAQFYQDVMTAK